MNTLFLKKFLIWVISVLFSDITLFFVSLVCEFWSSIRGCAITRITKQCLFSVAEGKVFRVHVYVYKYISTLC